MKKLISLLGTIVVTSSTILPVVSCSIPQEQQNEHLNGVSDEMLKMDEILNDIINNGSTITDQKELMNTIIQAELILKDTTNETYFYALSNDVAQVVSMHEEILTNIPYQTPTGEPTTAYQVFSDYLDQCDVNFQTKKNSGAQELLQEYENYKSEEAKLFYDVFDWRNSAILDQIVGVQDRINQLNTRNKEIRTQIEGLDKQNDIINKILNILDTTQGFAQKVKDIFDNAINNVNKNYDRALWHENNWGLGFIPFIGIGFNLDFKDAMSDTTSAMQVYVDTFKDGTGEGADAMQDLTSSLTSLKGDIESLDPTGDIIDGILSAANFDGELGNALSFGIHTVVDVITKAMGPFGPVFKAILGFLSDAFNAYNLHIEFGKFNDSYTRYFKDQAASYGDKINDAYNQIQSSKLEFTKNYNTNLAEIKKLTDEMNNNLNELDDLNQQLDILTDTKNSNDSTFTTLVDIGMYSDYMYYWRANEIGSINPIKATNELLSSNPIDEIKKVNELKKDVYNRLILKLPNGEMKAQFVSDYNATNILENGIINLK
jgi:prefoldin subunit 5